MNFPGNFMRIGHVDPEPLAAEAGRLTDADWDAYAFRQQRYEVHRDTQTIGLVFDPDFRHTHPTRLPRLEQFEPAIRPALQLIAAYYEESAHGRELTARYGLGYFVRATLVRLVPGGAIDPHTDNNFSLTHSHRVHVPALTNDRVLFSVGGEVINMKPGEVFEINNRRMHSVENRGDANRIHLILDFVLPGEQCCCGRRRHPETRCSPQACMDTDYLRIPCTCFADANDGCDTP